MVNDLKEQAMSTLENRAEEQAQKQHNKDQRYVRRGPDRRKNPERRYDPREIGGLSLKARIKALFKPRVGVDRRKGDRRRDRDEALSAELTPEELKQLLD